jgi:hypothetical protein
MKRIAFFACILSAAVVFAQKTPVVKPRARVHEYPAVKELQNVTLGAAQLSTKQVRKSFVSNIGKEYVVVEVGLYPKDDTKISLKDFGLREQNARVTIAAADPQLLASHINEKDQQGTDVSVHPVAGVSYSTGPAPNEPYYGRGGGWRTETGVIVGVNGRKKDPKTSDADLKVMAAELSEKGLPEIATAKPVAGYLYFHVPADHKAHYQLEYQSPAGPVAIPLPAPAE